MTRERQDLILQATAAYFDGVSKIMLASQAILLKQMNGNQVEQNLEAAAEEALGVLMTDLLMGAAAAAAAAAGAMEAAAAEFDQEAGKYMQALKP